MITQAERTRAPGSRIHGRGALLRTFRALIRRLDRYREHRAATPDEQLWAARLHDALEAAFAAAAADASAAASLRAVDARRSISRKARPGSRNVLFGAGARDAQ